ncbi:MAG TPA: MFS transporter [Streptosporangiaceae bacterium]|nr:MFS transporter [Streptosporangiaceae bacterium]
MTAVAVPCPRRVRLFRVLAYALVLASSGTQFAVVPVVPDYAQRLGLSGLQQGLVLGATGLACLAVSVPAGSLSDRLGARKLTLWAGALMTVAVLMQALAGSFLLLLAARLAFGTGYAVVWTAGLAWLERAAPGGLGLGGPVASAGIGSVAGPALSGFLVEYFGLASPFLAAAAVFALLTGGLALLRMPAVAPAPSARMRASLRAAVSDRRTLAAAAAIVTAGGTTGVAALLAPRQLHAAGASPGRIGLAFAAAGVIFVMASALTASAGRRAVRIRVLLAGMLALAFAFSPAALSQAPVAILGMLCATTAARAVLWTVSYPLAAAGAERSGAGLGVVMGLLNGVWAATVLLGPLLAGLGAEIAGAQVTFGLTAVVCLAVLAAAIPAAGPLRVPGRGARGTPLARGLPGGRGVPGRPEPGHQNGNGTRPVPAPEASPQPPSPHPVRLSGRHEDHRH